MRLRVTSPRTSRHRLAKEWKYNAMIDNNLRVGSMPAAGNDPSINELLHNDRPTQDETAFGPRKASRSRRTPLAFKGLNSLLLYNFLYNDKQRQ